jgi:hypothetical protein
MLCVFFYSLVYVSLFNVISYYYNGNFFVFSEIDARQYHLVSLRMVTMPVLDSITYVLKLWKYEDLGAVMIISTIYRIAESNLALNVFYIFVGIRTALGIFNIGKSFMSVKYAFLAALTYSVSSYILWFHSSGLKESFMIFLLVMFFEKYFLFVTRRSFMQLVFAALYLAALLLFRPALTFFGLGAAVLGFVFSRKLSFLSIVFLIASTVIIIFSLSFITEQATKYSLGSTDDMLSAKEAMIKGGVGFTYVVNTLGALIGPLPTLSPNFKQTLSIYAPGLIFRVFLAFAFWLSVYFVIKKKVSLLYPLLIFILLEMVSLVYILESLELRKSLSHFPFMYIMMFWFLDRFEHANIMSLVKKKQVLHWCKLYTFAATAIIIFWNLRSF